jgi:fructuronate reductase
VTEAAYLRTPDGGLDASRDVVQRDLKALRKDPRDPVDSLPARLVAGLVARRSAGAAALTILSYDNLPENGAVTKTVVRDLAALLDARRPLRAVAVDVLAFVSVDSRQADGAPLDLRRAAG